ncbi:MAG: hypothetical protein AVDCRST_MAG07-2492 [uncultured Frankineae bacterium]|uniref:ABC3 transporter permease C-terminal domain-containing protein n=1 Tax=uncultured Frankineae bacterium TaxID=437475 RepID=A0A6J4LLR8_9ACTN|nr:MAG: hypothetical protein AVDCRST_MAG07-2492 [uncultured Frankineae bacterium]
MTVLLERPADTRRRAGGTGWRPALRIARRELLRARARTLVVLLMVLLPVTGVVALDTLLRTADVSAVESLPVELGDADARIDLLPYGGAVLQSPDGREMGTGPGSGPMLDERALRAALPPASRLLLVRESVLPRAFRAGADRVVRAGAVGADLREAAGRGPFRLRSGRAPAGEDEVAVSPELAERGLRAGTTLTLPDGRSAQVTGTVSVPPLFGDAVVVGQPEAVGLKDAPVSRAYVSGAEVSWTDVRELNARGGLVLSRAVVLDPPPEEQVPELPVGSSVSTAALIGLIVVMAVLEVVLLAGPAFAVGARRSRRALALLAATGGEPRHVRRVVLAQGLLVGGSAAVLGAVLGIAVAAGARGPLTRWADAQWGPFEVSVRDVVLLALLGAGTAVLAALLPAHLAAREPVVASLRGRRPSPAATALPTTLGLVLFGLGAVTCLASLRAGSPELLIAFSALPTVVGAVLLAPVVLHLLGRRAGRLPLPLRYTLRDADRQRPRTAPAVAAVAATVAAAFALGTATGSDAEQERATYSRTGPVGAAVVTGWPGPTTTDWPALEAAARRALPGEPVRRVAGLASDVPSDGGTVEQVQLCLPDAPRRDLCEGPMTSYNSGLGSSTLVGEGALEAVAPLLAPGALPTARQALRTGAVVVLGPTPATLDVRRVRVEAPDEGGAASSEQVAEVSAPAVPVQVRDATAPAQAVLPDALGARLGGVGTVSLLVGDGLSVQEERRLLDQVSLVDSGASVFVERGARDDAGLALLLLVLAAGALVLAGTLAATSLALVEAQPDFAVLAQVGARPRTRRVVAGTYAAVLALVGGLLGVAAGSVPGLTAAVALTRTGLGVSGPPGELPSPWTHVEVPWLLLVGLLGVLPVLAGALAALTVRSTPASAAVRRAV